MKKFLTFLTALMLACCCLLTACSLPNGDGGGDEGGLTRQEQAQIYKEVAVQSLSRMGIELQPETVSGVSGFSVFIPDKKTETTDEGAIHSIKFNAKDTAGIMWLLSMLYENDNFITVDGLAKFDATYSAPTSGPDGITTEQIFQTLCIKSNIDKQTGKVSFESMVTWESRPGAYGYSIGDFTFNFETSTLRDCRFIMTGTNGAYVDMMLTDDNRYLWYETETADDFTTAVDASMQAFNDECAGVNKLTGNFDAEMQAYVDDLTQGATNPGPSNPGDGGGNAGEGEGSVIEGEGGTKPTNPTTPDFVQVDEDTWNNLLSLNQLPDFCLTIMWNNNIITYTVDADMFQKQVSTDGTPTSDDMYLKDGDTYYHGSIPVDGGTPTKDEITENEYYEQRNKALFDLADAFSYSSFNYLSDMNYYYLEEIASLELANVTIRFNAVPYVDISFLKDGVNYNLSISFIR